MLTIASKWFLGLGAFAMALAAAYGYTTGGTLLGPVTAGWFGAVGDHTGYTILLAIAAVSIVLGVLALACRDADPEALAQLVGGEVAPVERPPASAAWWPILGAFGAALVVLGLVTTTLVFVAGIVVLAAVLLEWMVLAWSDRATGDPATNKQVRDRLMRPLEFPVAAALSVLVAVFGTSQLFLTLTAIGAAVAAGVIAAVVLAVAAILATRPRLPAGFAAGLLLATGVGLVGAGVASVVRGERAIEPKPPEEVPRNVVRIPPGVGIEAPGAAGGEQGGG